MHVFSSFVEPNEQICCVVRLRQGISPESSQRKLAEHVAFEHLCLQEGAKATTQAALASLDAWDRWDGRGQLSEISSPTLILWSNKDRSYDLNQQNILIQGIKNSRLEIIKDCAHNSHMEQPKLVNNSIKQFLT